MCGIIGVVNFNNNLKISRNIFVKALNKMRHRGPDDYGLEQDSFYLLGHRRLSILDLDVRSKQPMTTEDDTHIIVFNGEIYNFQDLKLKLQKRGVKFLTTSDTEVLLKGFKEHGEQFIQMCNGMFSFCIINKVTKTAYLFRDRMGIKPLYYSFNKGNLYFSSTVESLLEINSMKPSLREESLISYLAFRYPIGHSTFFEGVYSLEAGHCLIFNNQKLSNKSYWNLNEFYKEETEDKGIEHYKNKVLNLLKQSVQNQMISDVPIGAYLSGGVDSSGLVALMDEYSTNPIKTYSIGYKEENYNEFEYSREVAKLFNTEHHEISHSCTDYLEKLQELIHLKGAPLSVPNEVPIWELSKELKRDITVVLSGEGADELFWGYGRLFRSPYDFQRTKRLYSWESIENKKAFYKKFNQKYGQDFSQEVEHFLYIYSYTSEQEIQSLLSKDIKVKKHYSSLKTIFASHFNSLKNLSYGKKISYTMSKLHIPGLLQRLDNGTMAASVEGRVPFLDHKLVEYVSSIPDNYKLKWKSDNIKTQIEISLADEISENFDIPKFVLKEVFSSYLTSKILYRKKLGFPVPLDRWFNGTFRGYTEDILLSSEAKSRFLFDAGVIRKWLSEPDLQVNHKKAMTVWMLLNFELFMQNYL